MNGIDGTCKLAPGIPLGCSLEAHGLAPAAITSPHGLSVAFLVNVMFVLKVFQHGQGKSAISTFLVGFELCSRLLRSTSAVSPFFTALHCFAAC